MSLTLLSLLLAALLPVVAWGARLARDQPDVADVDQRLRVASSTIRLALDEAGAGALGGDAASALAGRIPMIFPHWRGVEAGDAYDSAFTDRLTVLAARRSGWDVDLGMTMLNPSADLALSPAPPCPPADGRCGFRRGDVVAIHDGVGRFDLLRLANVDAYVLTPAAPPLVRAFSVGDQARATPVAVHQFRFDAARRQLRSGAGDGSDAPLLDGVTGMALEYYGAARPPPGPRPPLGVANCLFDAGGHSTLPVLPGAVNGTARLDVAQFTDGPFCGDGRMRYDADLLRIRRIVVRIGLASPASAGAVGQPSPLTVAAIAREVVIDVAPRNLETAR